MDPNDRKLRRYNDDPEAWDRANDRFDDVYQWKTTDKPISYRDALEMCREIPPVARTGESASSAMKTLSEKERNTYVLTHVFPDPEWVENSIHTLASRFAQPYPKEHRAKLVRYLVTNRYKPEPPETDERWTDIISAIFSSQQLSLPHLCSGKRSRLDTRRSKTIPKVIL
jgi:hypothetical protein